MHPRVTTGQSGSFRLTAEDVADLLETVCAANCRMAAAVDLIVGSRAGISQTTLDRFVRLAAELRPGTAARAELAALHAELLMVGTALWMQRRLPAKASAASRAAQRWSGGQSA